MDGATPHKSNGAATHPPGDKTVADTITDIVDVLVEAFIGDTSVTLGDLNKLRKGDVLRLAASLSDPIELRVNGRCIGRGELVAVGDQFAVRISEIE